MMALLEKVIRRINDPGSSVEKEQLQSMSIVVASMGRCGSTMLYKTLNRCGFSETEFVKRFDEAPDFINGNIYKTHALPPDSLPANVKLIYLFGDPLDIVVSAHRSINFWGRRHHEHLGSDLYRENNDIFEQDTLQLYRHFDRWYKAQAFEFISIKYEALYTHRVREALNKHLGFELTLPPRRDRRETWRGHPREEDLLRLYGPLKGRIEKAEDVRIWTPQG